MQFTNFPQEAVKFEIQAYKRPKNLHELIKTHVPFSGSPRRHPYDKKKIILFVDPYSSHTIYYEFKAEDISFVEELPSIVNLAGETITMTRIWVNKMSVGVRCSPFVVADTRTL